MPHYRNNRLCRKTDPEQRCLNPACHCLLLPTDHVGRPRLYCDTVCRKLARLYWQARLYGLKTAKKEYVYEPRTKKYSYICAHCGGKNPKWQRFCSSDCKKKFHSKYQSARRSAHLKFAKENHNLPEIPAEQITGHEWGMRAILRARKHLEQRYYSDEFVISEMKKANKLRENKITAREEEKRKYREKYGPDDDDPFWNL